MNLSLNRRAYGMVPYYPPSFRDRLDRALTLFTAAVIGAVLGVPFGAYIVVTNEPVTLRSTTTWQPCANEDGPGPCVWDSRHMGNGQGHSVKIKASGAQVRITHRRAHRMLGW